MYGARYSLLIGIVSVFVGLSVGLVLGAAAGYFGGIIDSVIMRSMDVMLSIPSLLLAIGIVAVLGPGFFQIMIAVGVVQIPIFARLLRGSVLAQKENDFVLAARSVGVPRRTILASHILPNAISPLIVQGTLAMATAIIDVAGLGFLGLGPPDPGTPEWGTMLSDVNRYFQSGPHLAIAPGVAIVLTVLGFNLIGDAPARGARPEAAQSIDEPMQRLREPLLSVEDLRVEFWTSRGTVHAVNGITFDIAPGETLGIVGESGCGKSVTSLALLGILSRAGRVTGGTAMFEGRDLLQLKDDQLRQIRGRDIAMIFQDPMTSLNPVLTVGRQIREALETHFDLEKKEANDALGRAPRPRRHPQPEDAPQGLPAPVLGRHAPARDDRHGARLRAEAPDRGRADDGARRHHPGADPRPPARSSSSSRTRRSSSSRTTSASSPACASA